VGTNRALQQATQQYNEFVTPLQKLATKIKKIRDAMETADATFQETPEEKELYGIIKEIAEYKLPAAPGAAGASAVTGAAAPAATGAAAPAAPAAGIVAPVTASVGTSDITDPSDVTFTFLDQTFTVENDFAGEELKPKQKQFLTDMNILPILEPVLKAPQLLTILNNIVTKSTCKVDYGLSMLEECNPMRSMLSILQEAMWKGLIDGSTVKHSTSSGSKSSTRTGTSGFTTITITLPMADLYAAMI
jgi:hypothetical protein